MNPLRLVGHVLLWIGFFGGVYLAVMNVEVADDKWSTVNWPLYGAALAVGIGGVFILRMTSRQLATHADKLDADIQTLEVSVEKLRTELTALVKNKQNVDVYTVHKLIDSQLTGSISNFVESRQTLIHTYGLRQYAELMTDFSIAERNINRAWSASADGYVDEVWLSLDRADNRLQVVAQNLTAYKKEMFGS